MIDPVDRYGLLAGAAEVTPDPAEARYIAREGEHAFQDIDKPLVFVVHPFCHELIQERHRTVRRKKPLDREEQARRDGLYRTYRANLLEFLDDAQSHCGIVLMEERAAYQHHTRDMFEAIDLLAMIETHWGNGIPLQNDVFTIRSDVNYFCGAFAHACVATGARLFSEITGRKTIILRDVTLKF